MRLQCLGRFFSRRQTQRHDESHSLGWGVGGKQSPGAVCWLQIQGLWCRFSVAADQPPLEAPRMSPGGKASGRLMRIWAERPGHPQPLKPTAVQRPGGFQGCVLSPLAGPGWRSGLAHEHLLGREPGRLQGLIWRLRPRQDLCLVRRTSL